ncbi:MAG: LysM peptidoglycan-binding domain-containing protein [Bacteroidales bacterium]|nr:LysM peptidoglycan-binding domain-containing protein [Lachnoclostridium sp.]MCM1464542.1 LysM peptidoglycan-binding domain-containing protein [Bacteroidales bacterium]
MKKKKVLPIVLAFCMVLGSLPGDLLGGVMRVQAAAIEESVEGSNPADVPMTVSGSDSGTVSGSDSDTVSDSDSGTVSGSDAGTVGSVSNAVTWDVAAMLATWGDDADADHGLKLMGNKWESGGPDSAGAEAFGTDGTYAKASGDKPNPNSGAVPQSGCFIKYTATEDGKLVISEKTQKSNKTFYVVDSQGAEKAKATAGSASTYDDVEVDVVAGETYYAYMSAATANVFKVSFTPVQTVRTWDVAAMLATWGDDADADHGLKLMGNKWESGGPDSAGAEAFGTDGTYAKASGDKPNPNSGAVPQSGCFIKYTATEDGKLVISEKTQKSNKTFYVVDSQGAEKAKATAGSASTYDDVEVDVVAGETYYAYMSAATANVFQVTFTVGEKETIPWAEVAAPVINSVTVDGTGQFVVDFTAVIDEYKGAEEVRVIMYYEGSEAGAVQIKKASSSATIMPMWSGNYTFKVIAKRTGEADKASAEYPYNDYVLPVKKPIVELIQNRGNGTVYLDWLNVEGADYFNVYYKESSAADYTKAAENLTDGNYTVANLTVGTGYDFKIEAVRTSDNFTVNYEEKNFTVTADREQKWYFGTVGSAQGTHAVVYNADGTTAKAVDMQTDDATVDKGEHQGIMDPGVDIVNTDKYITFTGTGNGKLSDGEEGFQYFYTMLDPNKDNFELTATFEVTQLAQDKFDNQTGFGIIATDMLGYNYYGTKGLWIKHKQFNSVATTTYGLKNFLGQRNISGYTSCDTTSVDGVTRETYQTQFKNTPAPKVNEETFKVGDKYTFTLKKTNEGYVSVLNGEEILWEDLSITSVQEDGSICVGVYTARNAGVKITDIKFACTDDSTGITAVDKDSKVAPSAAVLSSGTANTSSYEYIYHPNVAGQLTVTASDGSVVYDNAVEAYDVVKVPVPVSIGENTITSSLVPDQSQALTSYDTITKNTKVTYQVYRGGIGNLYVSPEGSAEGDGTSSSPLDVATAVKYVAPGQKIILLNGTYTGGVTIGRSVCGTADKHIVMAAEETGKVIFEGAGLNVVGSYWDIYGIYVHYPAGVGIQICGNYNTIEMCTVEGSTNTGIQISRSGSVDREPALKSLLWPSYNLVKNCESFDCCDEKRNDADGFAAKLTCGEGNVFYGCIAHNNIDDGWDLFAKAISGEIGQVTIENCVAYNNGWLTYEAGQKKYGEGNGFKLGGNDMYGGHILKNSVSFGNIAKGITSNSCPDCKVYNTTSYGNAVEGSYAFQFATKTSNKQQWVVQGLISATTTATEADSLPYSFHTSDNYFFDGKTSHNNQGVTVSDDWFESVDMSIVPTRNEDGTINMHGLLVLTANAPADAGARLDTTSDKAKSVNPLGSVPKDDNEVFGDDNSDDDDDDDDGSSAAGGSAAEFVAEVDWNAAVSAVDTAAKNKAAKNLDITAGDSYEVPTNVLNKLKGTNDTLALHSGGGITLSITGTDIKTNVAATFKMAMSHGNVIPASVANQVLASATESRIFSMDDKSSYPFVVNVHVNLGAANAGKTAYLYYYDEKSNSMMISGSFRITAAGQAMFAIYRGDEYIIAVSDKPAAVKGKYEVQSGDSLSRIAGKAGITLNKLMAENPQIKNANMIVPGQQINLP